jgi:hypothetical protein
MPSTLEVSNAQLKLYNKGKEQFALLNSKNNGTIVNILFVSKNRKLVTSLEIRRTEFPRFSLGLIYNGWESV